MSTRRARIKAVAALPQRRKNADNAANKLKQEQTKEVFEYVIINNAAVGIPLEKSPARTVPSPRLLPSRKSPRALLTPEIQEGFSIRKVAAQSSSAEKRSTSPLKDKSDSVIPTTSRADVFVSPPARASALRRYSPAVRTPVIEVEVSGERLTTSHKRLTEIQVHTQKQDKVAENILSSPKAGASGSQNVAAKNLLDGYNSPNTPENDVMDGIVPLKPVSNAPKPIELLKNEIISENAEVLFDPIVPLPSPTKVRPKLRPVPRLGPLRRNSIPGSASESEDESRRNIHPGSSTPVPARHRHDSHTSHSTATSHPNRDVNRVRNDSMCSSQMAPQTPAPASPMKEKEKISKNRRMDINRRMTATRRRKESVQRDKMTMFDLIFYNPDTNPIVPDEDELKAKEASKKDEDQRKLAASSKKEEEESNDASSDSAPVPQIKLGPNGEIILDEQSLVIKPSEQRKLSDSVVHEGSWASSTSKVYRRTQRTAEWTDAETVRFYRALATLGTDFSLMVALFPGRSRKDLKLKFKKEEKNNLAQIDKALRSVSELDPERLEKEFAEERRKAEEKARKLQERLQEEKRAHKEKMKVMKEMGVKQSKAAKAIEIPVIPDPQTNSEECISADDFIERTILARKEQSKRKRENKKLQRAAPVPIPRQPQFATLTPISEIPKPRDAPRVDNFATIQRISHNQFTPPTVPQKSPLVLNALPNVSTDIAPGSLVVLTVDDPKAPSKKAIHTYIKQADGSIASIILEPNVMSSLVSYVKKDTPKAGSISSMSPSSVISDRSRTSTPVSASPNKRQRLSSYSITDL